MAGIPLARDRDIDRWFIWNMLLLEDPLEFASIVGREEDIMVLQP